MKHRVLFLGFLAWNLLYAAPILAQQPALQAISEARRQALGSVVRVAGRVSAAAELGITSYIQDATGGLAVFNTSFTSSTALGDSVEITGALSEFQATTGIPGSGLLQLSSNNLVWRIIPSSRIAPSPRNLALRDISENAESLLIRLNSVQFLDSGVFRGNTNYLVSDGSTSAQIRISNGTNLVNTSIPRGRIAVTGVLGQFRGTYQISPRFLADVGQFAQANPFDTIPKSRTLDITTWNMKWFGRPRDNDGVTVLGPADSLLQLRNAIRLLDSINADIIGVQEVSNTALFRQITDSLPRYGMAISTFAPPQPQFVPQRTAFLYKKAEMDTVRSTMLLTNTAFAAGRFPFMLDVRLRNAPRTASFIVIHAKSGSTARDYELRTTDAMSLYEAVRPLARYAPLVLLGDFNDGLITSIVNNQVSPYAPFLNDSLTFFPATLSLGRQGFSSFASGNSMIDNILISTLAMRPAMIHGAEKVENTSFIPSYIQSTSDHYPVTARFFPERIVNVINTVASPFEQTQVRVIPNPAQNAAHVRFSLKQQGMVRFQVVNMLGAKVIEIPETPMQSGEQHALLDVQTLPSGMYVVSIECAGAVQRVSFAVVR